MNKWKEHDENDHEFFFVFSLITISSSSFPSGIVSGPCEALLADSTTPSERSHYFHLQFVCSLTASMIGPLCAMMFFRSSGNLWDLSSLQTVMYMGLGMESVNAWIMMYFDDDKALDDTENEEEDSSSVEEEDEESENAKDAAAGEADSSLTDNFPQHRHMTDNDRTPNDNLQSNPLLQNNGPQQNLPPPTTYGSLADDDMSVIDSRRRPQSTLPARKSSNHWAAYRYLIPYLLCTADFVESIGSGLVWPFVPLFFKDTCGMSPGRVQVLYALIPVGKVALSTIPPRLAAVYGRLETILVFWGVSVVLFGTIPAFESFYQGHHGLLMAVYIAKRSFGGAIGPLEETLLIDVVPKSQRARWLTFDSVLGLAGTVAAIVGGYIVEKWGYRMGFTISVVIQLMAWCIYTMLLLLMPSSGKMTRR